MTSDISSQDNHRRKRVTVLDSQIDYIDVGDGDPVVFLHGNPTSAYLWRNVIPHIQEFARCLAPDLIGMGRSGKAPDGQYRFINHSAYLDQWFESLSLNENVTLVVHDWGSALGFYWANRYPERVKGIAYMEAIVQPLTWDMWPEAARNIFQNMRTEAGEDMVLGKNIFVERILPASIMRTLSEYELNAYKTPYIDGGESRRPTLTWPREIPIDGTPEDVNAIVSNYSTWLKTSALPKLFINANPGSILTGVQREFCRKWPNQSEVTVEGVHFIQEDSPDAIGVAIANWLLSL